MPILRPIFCAIALVGIHITKPFQALLIDVDTNYSTLAIAFPKLYDELKTIHTIDLCSTTIQVLTFMSNEAFESCIPEKAVCQAIDDCIQVYKEQIVPLMKVIISKLLIVLIYNEGLPLALAHMLMMTQDRFLRCQMQLMKKWKN